MGGRVVFFCFAFIFTYILGPKQLLPGAPPTARLGQTNTTEFRKWRAELFFLGKPELRSAHCVN